MQTSPSLFVAVGGVFLIAWYSLSRARATPRHSMAAPPPMIAPMREVAELAIASEFTDRTSPNHAGGTVCCHDCGTEYPAGVLFCDCGGETAEAEEEELCPADDLDAQEPWCEQDYVCVFQAESSWQALLLKNYLESHSIPCRLTNGAPFSFVEGSEQGSTDEPIHGIQICVPSEDVSLASQLLTGVQ